MLPFIIGGVTLAAVGYGIKECIKNDDCVSTTKDKLSDGALALYDSIDKIEEKLKVGIYELEPTSTEKETLQTKETIHKLAKEFYKSKKKIYKNTLKQYKDFTEKPSIDLDTKLQKEIFEDSLVTSEVESYIKQILNTLDVISANLDINIRFHNTQVEKIDYYIKSIYELSHLKIFDKSKNINKIEILSTLVQSMESALHKDGIQLDLKT